MINTRSVATVRGLTDVNITISATTSDGERVTYTWRGMTCPGDQDGLHIESRFDYDEPVGTLMPPSIYGVHQVVMVSGYFPTEVGQFLRVDKQVPRLRG